MSAAVTRAQNLESGTRELTHPSTTDTSGELGGRTIIEVTKVARVDLGSISEHGMTPLMRAACDGSAGTVQALLDLGGEVNAKRLDGFNALALAAFFGHIHVVWLLLENGADPAATSGSQTLPETWADARGFLNIGEILREARLTKQAESLSPRTAVIDEPARFSRPAEEKPEPPPQPPVIPKAEPTLRMLPEIIDPPPLVVPAFHPGSVFVARITSSFSTLFALILAMLLLCGGTAWLLIPRIRNSLHVPNDAATKTTNFPTESGKQRLGSGANVSGTGETPEPATTESTTTTASAHSEGNAGATTANTTANNDGVDPTLRVVSIGESAGRSAGSGWRAYSRSSHSTASTVPEPSANNPEFSAATSASSSVPSPRMKWAASRIVKSKQKSATEEQPKPAPLTIEMSRRGSVPAPAKNAKEVSGSQPPPLGIISDKPKPKVIQWP